MARSHHSGEDESYQPVASELAAAAAKNSLSKEDSPQTQFDNLASTSFLNQGNKSVEDQLLRMAALVQENEAHNRKVEAKSNTDIAAIMATLTNLTTAVQGLSQTKPDKPSQRKQTTFDAIDKRRESILPIEGEKEESRTTRQRRARRSRERSRSTSPNLRDGDTSKIECLTDEKDGVLFKYWETEVREKLNVNHHKFQTEAAKMLFVFNRTQGRARSFLHPRYNHRAKDPYTSWEQMMETLERIFVNPHAQRLARKKYAALLGEDKIAIHDFIAEFTILADEAEVPYQSRFDDFYDKLPPWVQDGLSVNLPNYLDLDSLFEAARRYTEEQYFIRENRKKRLESAVKKEPSKRFVGSATTTGAVTSAASQRFASDKPKYTPSPALVTDSVPATIRCYSCNQVGHKSPDCPQKLGKELKEIEEGVEELMDSEDDQEKDCT